MPSLIGRYINDDGDQHDDWGTPGQVDTYLTKTLDKKRLGKACELEFPTWRMPLKAYLAGRALSY